MLYWIYNKNKQKGNTDMTKTNIRKCAAVLLVLALAAALFSGCGGVDLKAKRIQGTWKGEVNILGVTTATEYTFNEDGTGSMSGALGLGLAIKYTLEDDQLTITTDTPIVQQTLHYTVSYDSGKLVLTDEQGTALVLTKQ